MIFSPSTMDNLFSSPELGFETMYIYIAIMFVSGNYKEPFCPHFQFKFECFGGALNRVHSYSRSSGSMRNDITDLT